MKRKSNLITRNKIITCCSLLILLFNVSCKKSFFYPGINNNPGSITQSQLTPSVLLNGAELGIGYTVGGDISRYSSLLVNSIQGYNRQFAAYNSYIFSAQDFDNVWANIYEQGLNNLNILKQISDQKGYNYYSGISRVLLAYYFGVTTDMWGDIPRSNALQGQSGVVQPTYEGQQSIYTSLQSTLDSAITMLSATGKGILPGNDDFIYGGSASRWIAFANGLKARYYLHLSKQDPTYADKVLTVLPNAIASSAGNAAVPFFNNENQANPWYQYQEQRGDISYVNAYLNTQLNSISDPRASAYIDQVNDAIGNLLAGISSPVTLQSYTELLFMKAEALSAKNDPTATIAYNAAVTSAFADANVAMPVNYLVTNALTGATHAARLPQIIKQKYFALFTQPEVFNDWRRTGYPALTPNTAGGQIPRRFLYPQAELSYNGANVPQGTTLYTRVWWDK